VDTKWRELNDLLVACVFLIREETRQTYLVTITEIKLVHTFPLGKWPTLLPKRSICDTGSMSSRNASFSANLLKTFRNCFNAERHQTPESMRGRFVWSCTVKNERSC
jgi:hypothetical protein